MKRGTWTTTLEGEPIAYTASGVERIEQGKAALLTDEDAERAVAAGLFKLDSDARAVKRPAPVPEKE